MDEPALRWPYWKFGFKKGDLSTKLQEQYNTVKQPISDPVAFHHDVFEISHLASTAEEFHELMSARKQSRLDEVQASFLSASFELGANPALTGPQWASVVQLIKTKSLDSLVGLLSSYVPESHEWHQSDCSSSSSVSGDSASVDEDATSHSENTMFFDDELDMKLKQWVDPFEAEEQQQMQSPSKSTCMPRFPVDLRTDKYPLDFVVPSRARTLSFSESEPDLFQLEDSCPSLHHDGASETSASSVADSLDLQHQDDLFDEDVVNIKEAPTALSRQMTPLSQSHDTSEEFDLPTPKPRPEAGECFLMKSKPWPTSASSRLPGRCDTSPFRTHILSGNAIAAAATWTDTTGLDVTGRRQTLEHQYSQRQSPSPARLHRRDRSPPGKGRSSRHGVAVTTGRILKPLDTKRMTGRTGGRESL